MPKYTNIFHTLCSKLGIRDSEKFLILKYRSGLQRYIETGMDFMDISSLGFSYRYAPGSMEIRGLWEIVTGPMSQPKPDANGFGSEM